MKKRILLLIVSCVFVISASLAQKQPITHEQNVKSTLLFEDFENGMPANFTLIDADGLTPYSEIFDNAWIVYYGEALSTSYYIPAGSADDWMITPMIFVPENGFLTWDAHCLDESYPDGYSILISTTGTNTSDFTSEIFSLEAESIDITSHSIDLQSLGIVNQNIYVAFRNTSYDGVAIAIDNIRIYTAEQYDVGVSEIVAPVSGCDFSTQDSITITVQNFGYDTVSTFQVTYEINGVASNPETIIDTLIPGQSINYTFNQTADFSIIGSYTISAYTFMQTDGEPMNNLSEVTINTGNDLTNNYTLNFTNDEIDKINLWNVEDANSDANSWLFETDNNFAYIDLSGGDADDWLFSNCFNLSSSAIYEVQFYYFPYNQSDIMNLYVTINDEQNSSSLIDTLLVIENIQAITNWQIITHQFSIPNNGSYNIGFHVTGIQANQEYFLLTAFQMRRVFPYDLGIEGILSPVTNCEMTDSEHISVFLKNYGLLSLSNFNLNYSVNSGNIITETVGNVLNPGDTMTYIFNTTTDMLNFGNYTIKVFSDVANDGYLFNDTTLKTVSNSFDFSAGNYFMSFEPNEDFGDWSTYNANEDEGIWYLMSEIQPRTGMSSAMYYYDSNNDADDWLISRCFYFDNTKHYKISFWYSIYDATYPEQLSLYLTSSQNPDKSPQALINLGEITNENYIQAEAGFMVDESGIYKFQWHATSEADMYFIFVDDIEVKEIDCSGTFPQGIDLGADIVVQYGIPVVLDAGEGFQNYLWSTGETTQTINVTISGDYFVTAWDSCMNESSDSIMVTILDINEIENQNINVFPNPVKNVLHIVSEKYLLNEIEMYDCFGKMIIKEKVHENYFEINVNKLAKGNYFVKISTNENLIIEKLITIE